MPLRFRSARNSSSLQCYSPPPPVLSTAPATRPTCSSLQWKQHRCFCWTGRCAHFLRVITRRFESCHQKFSSEFVVSKSGEKFPNVVYKGCLHNQNNRRWIAVKKFTNLAWPDPKQFDEEASGVGKLRNKRLANLIGYFCDGDERLMVVEFMPNDKLA